MQTIVTHSGSFDPDDVLAVATVRMYLGENVEVIRSRVPEVIEKADWVLDVGGIFDPATNRFDHHQNGVPCRDNGVPYSAFGLVWRVYGADVCGSVEVAAEIEDRLVLAIDAADNHVTVCDAANPEVLPFEFFDVIDSFKPIWGSDETFDSEFFKAVDFAQNLLTRLIAQANGRRGMQQMIRMTYEQTEDKTVLVFEEPVARHTLVGFHGVQVVVSPVPSLDITGWMAATVPSSIRGFHNQATFPETWAGLVDDELIAVSGIDGAVFCHKERYVFVAKTKEAALQAAWAAIEHSSIDLDRLV
ncbi:MAG: MYG1 family protein [Candidatus Pacebacteria bacterium]|nr:MYG1 family protein [Candidatus Paceibacterota bacterium]